MEEFNIECYKHLAGLDNKDFVVIDDDSGIMYKEISLVKVYEICKDKDPLLFFKKFAPYELQEKYMKEGSLSTLKNYEAIQHDMVENQKIMFGNFKREVLVNSLKFHKYTFKPYGERYFEQNKVKYINIDMFKSEFANLKPDKSKHNKFYHIEVLLKNIFQEGYDHFIKFLAWKLQHPTELIPCHWIIQDNGGTGKTEILCDFVLERLFPISVIGQDELHGVYTNYMENSVFVIAEEIEGYENEKKIKMLTGAKSIMINDKFKSIFRVPNYNNWIILSNDIKPLKIGTQDRRFNVVGGGKRLVALREGDWTQCFFKSAQENKDFFKQFHENFDTQIKAMYQYLLSLSVDRLEVQQTLNTKLKKDLEEINYTSEQEFFRELEEIGLDNMIKQYYAKNMNDYFEHGLIIRQEDNADKYSYYLKVSYLNDLYVDYCRKSNYRQVISKNHLLRRLALIKGFDTFFGETKCLSHNGEKCKVITLNTYKDDNYEKNHPVVIDKR